MSGVSFKDRGKTRLAIPQRVAELIQRTVVRATAALFQAGRPTCRARAAME
jgi:hypothetical protein